MRFNEYQKQAIAFRSKDLTDRESKLTMMLGLCTEAGEAGELVKKQIGHGHEMDKDKLCKELGDVLWYIAAVADEYGISMNDIARGNIKKLNDRYKQGKFTSEESKNRKEYKNNKNNKNEFELTLVGEALKYNKLRNEKISKIQKNEIVHYPKIEKDKLNKEDYETHLFQELHLLFI